MAFAQPAKAVFVNTRTNERIAVMYNPEQFTLDQGNNFAEVGIPGLNAPPVQYVRGKGRTLAMELLFDTYEQKADVRRYTDQVVRLLDKLPDTHAPPVLMFVMGQFSFRCVLAEAGQRFTMFLSDGTPVRSSLSVRLHEFVEAQVKVERGFFFGPPTLRNIAQGETVSSIASKIYGDPTRWREIADANNILDPLNPPVGLKLVIPGKTKR